ncbi:GntR family transcriptional regulator, partial [Actinokineospora sp.]|uniref:GntR family transcriptional regulator n=1 Tax=Actinokineospora sp. TaxID=1872133 RepID=UPI003D6BBEB3
MSESSSIEALATTLQAEIACLAPGDRLPSSRDLVRRHGVSPVTVTRAFAKLAAQGVVVTRPGSGTFVAPRRPSWDEDRADTSWQAVALGGRSAPAAPNSLLSPAAPGAIRLHGGY